MDRVSAGPGRYLPADCVEKLDRVAWSSFAQDSTNLFKRLPELIFQTLWHGAVRAASGHTWHKNMVAGHDPRRKLEAVCRYS
jgi:hypothetical protein